MTTKIGCSGSACLYASERIKEITQWFPTGGHGTLSRGPRDLNGRKNTYFGHECQRKFREISQRKFWKKYFDLRWRHFFCVCVFFNENSDKIPSIWDEDLIFFLAFNEKSRKNTFKFGLQSVLYCDSQFSSRAGGHSMFPLIFCAFCAQKFWRVRAFSGNSPWLLYSKSKALFVSEIKWRLQKKCLHPKSSCFCVQIRWRPKKKGHHLKSSGVFVRKVYSLTYYYNFMLNNKMSEQEYVCAQQIYACAQFLKYVCSGTA